MESLGISWDQVDYVAFLDYFKKAKIAQTQTGTCTPGACAVHLLMRPSLAFCACHHVDVNVAHQACGGMPAQMWLIRHAGVCQRSLTGPLHGAGMMATVTGIPVEAAIQMIQDKIQQKIEGGA